MTATIQTSTPPHAELQGPLPTRETASKSLVQTLQTTPVKIGPERRDHGEEVSNTRCPLRSSMSIFRPRPVPHPVPIGRFSGRRIQPIFWQSSSLRQIRLVRRKATNAGRYATRLDGYPTGEKHIRWLSHEECESRTAEYASPVVGEVCR